MAPDAKKLILDFLDGKQYAVPLPALIFGLQDQVGADEVKAMTRELHEERKLCRAPVQKSDGTFFFVFWSIYFQTSGSGPVEKVREPEPVAEAAPELTPEQREALIERLEQDIAPQPKLTPLDVIDRWKLSYRLSRIIEIVGLSKRKGLSMDDAKLIGTLAKQHAEQLKGTEA